MLIRGKVPFAMMTTTRATVGAPRPATTTTSTPDRPPTTTTARATHPTKTAATGTPAMGERVGASQASRVAIGVVDVRRSTDGAGARAAGFGMSLLSRAADVAKRGTVAAMIGIAALNGAAAGFAAPPAQPVAPRFETMSPLQARLQHHLVVVKRAAPEPVSVVVRDVAPREIAAPRAPAAETVSPDGSFAVSGDQGGGMLRGRAPAGASIEAINMTAIATLRIHADETTTVATAGADGAFAGAFAMRPGDVVRMRVRADGKDSAWISFKANGLGADTTNATVAMYRLGLFVGNGAVRLENINPSRPLSEPGAILRFVNERTGEHRDFTMNDEGTFAQPGTLPGRDGDRFSVRVTDGTNDAALAQVVGAIQVGKPQGATDGTDLPDPKLHNDELDAEGQPRYHLVRYTGPLFDEQPGIEDVRQGAIGDCYLPSSVAAAVHVDPGLIQRMMKQNADGTYTVTFKERDWASRGYKDVQITVDGDLYVRSWGGPLYGTDDGAREPERMEMWWPILEKAYAQWRGGYNGIGNGGSSSTVFEHLFGRGSHDMSLRVADRDVAWRAIVTNVDAKSPVSAGTYGEHERAKYTNSGVYANHSYSVLGYEERADGRYVQLRNPWGESEPDGNGPNDGVFFLKLERFLELYQTLYTLEPK